MRASLITLALSAIAATAQERYYAEPYLVRVPYAIETRCPNGQSITETDPAIVRLLRVTWPDDVKICPACNRPDVAHGWYHVVSTNERTRVVTTQSVWQVTVNQLKRDVDPTADLRDADVTVAGVTVSRGTDEPLNVRPDATTVRTTTTTTTTSQR